MNNFNKCQISTSNFLILAICFFLFSSCGPTIHFLGDSYQPTVNIDVFYDEKDIEKSYTTIGKMTHGNLFDHEMEAIKNKMIEKAKSIGADGIVFLDVDNVHINDEDFMDEDRLSVTAKVIKYK